MRNGHLLAEGKGEVFPAPVLHSAVQPDNSAHLYILVVVAQLFGDWSVAEIRRRIARMISLEQVRIVIAATPAKGRGVSLNPLTVVVLDPGGHQVVAMEREDGVAYGGQLTGCRVVALT